MDITPHITNTAHYKCLESVEKSQHDLYLCYCGIQNCEPGYEFGPYVRNEYLIHVVISGEGIYTAEIPGHINSALIQYFLYGPESLPHTARMTTIHGHMSGLHLMG